MRIIGIASLIIVLFGVQSCTNNSESTSDSESVTATDVTLESPTEPGSQLQDASWKKVDDPMYTLEYPDNWESNYTGQLGMSMVAVSPKEGDDDKFRENVTLIIQDLKGEDVDVKTFVDNNSDEILATIPDSKLIEERTARNSEDMYREIQYTGTQAGFTLLYTQRFYIHNGYAFVFSFTCQQDKNDKFASTGTKILDSIVLK